MLSGQSQVKALVPGAPAARGLWAEKEIREETEQVFRQRDNRTSVRVAAVDFGTARVGVAVSDELGLMAHPRPYLSAGNLKSVLGALKALAEAEKVERFIVGLPRHLNGREGTSARRARRFSQLLEQATGLPVELVDEWLTTREAQARLHAQGLDHKASRERIDSASAAVLLQGWLDAHTPSDDTEG